MSNKVTNRSVTFVNSQSPLVITGEELDLDSIYSPNELVVEIHAAAINPIDYILYKLASPRLASKQPKAILRDFSGVVCRSGENVKDFKVGDRINGVFDHLYGGRGALSNYLVLDPEKFGVTPSVSFEGQKYDDFVLNAAWPLVFGTAYDGLFRFGQKLGPSSKILVIGASTAVGNAVVQIAKNYLKSRAVVGICSKNSIDYNREMGFDHLIPYDDGDLAKATKVCITDKLDGEKFDLIFDCVGNKDFFPCINDVLKPRCQNSYYVTIIGDKKVNYNAPSLSNYLPSWEMLRRYGPFRKYNYANFFTQNSKKALELGNELISHKEFVPQIDSVWDFDDYQQAFDRLTSNRAKGKVVIRVK
ncbi:LAMI_0B08724g1_1 [Lachancea mirantina]|uniref:LAMI_0B08724g1_1 n=1 Tax=Lachancea mirantina TaxID=1230905 RepID=A0A1G4IYM6_9SACH|nr:LAMI_0B08724g1_1 [Lachancea mirantina]